MYYVLSFGDADPLARETYGDEVRSSTLEWLDEHDHRDAPICLEVFFGRADAHPVLTISDRAKVYEYLSGGRRTKQQTPEPIRTPIPAWVPLLLCGMGVVAVLALVAVLMSHA